MSEVLMQMWRAHRHIRQDIADRCEEFHQMRWGNGYPPLHVSMKRLNNSSTVVTNEWWWR